MLQETGNDDAMVLIKTEYEKSDSCQLSWQEESEDLKDGYIVSNFGGVNQSNKHAIRLSTLRASI